MPCAPPRLRYQSFRSGIVPGMLLRIGRACSIFGASAHIIGSHGLAILGLTIGGSLVAVVADAPC